MGAMAKKVLKYDRFQKNLNQNHHFWIFSINSVRNELHTPFLPYFDAQHLIYVKISFCS